MVPQANIAPKVWLITGCTSGIGLSLLEQVLASGNKVVAAVRRPDALSSLEALYPATRLLIVELDVTDASQILAVFEKAKVHFGVLDVVVNNAGYALCGEIEGTPDDVARRIMDVNFWAPVNISREAVKFMRDINPPGQGGRIVNMSSSAGYKATPTFAFYSASKAALESFTQALNGEMTPAWNIKALIIEPGGVRTNILNATVQLPPPPAYTDPTSPTAVLRKAVMAATFANDARKVAAAVIRIVGERDPPFRLPLGTDAYCLVKSTAGETLSETEGWADLIHSTLADDVDKETILQLSGFA